MMLIRKLTSYVISPYSSGDDEKNSRGPVSEQVMLDRYHTTMAFVYQAMKRGLHVFSPILYCHEMAKNYHLPRGVEFWNDWNETWMDLSMGGYLLLIPGFHLSDGVEKDMKYLEKWNKPVSRVNIYTERDEQGRKTYTFDYAPLEALVV